MKTFPWVKYNHIIIPIVFTIVAVIIKMIAVYRNNKQGKVEMKNHFLLTGVEMCILSISIYLLNAFVLLSFFGVKLHDEYPNNIVSSALAYILVQIVLLFFSIAGFRSYYKKSFIANLVKNENWKSTIRYILIIFSFFMGYLSIKLLIMLLENSTTV